MLGIDEGHSNAQTDTQAEFQQHKLILRKVILFFSLWKTQDEAHPE